MHYLEVAEAKKRDGLRLVLTAGVPGPWGESAKAIFHVKDIEYAPVKQSGGLQNEELVNWTGHANAPQAIYDDEPARTGWAEILFLAERLSRSPSLLPASADARAEMFGLAHEICGEEGFGWARRLMILHPMLSQAGDAESPALAPLRLLEARYGYAPERGEAAAQRCADILHLLSERLHSQRGRGSQYFFGDALSAVDLYWAAFSAIVQPLPEESCPLPPPMRASYTATDPTLLEALDPILIEHRDFIYRQHLVLPLDF